MPGIFKAYDIRGTSPDQVNENIAFKVGYHYRDLLEQEDLDRGPTVVVTRDMRSHSVPLSEALKRGLRARGVSVVDAGVADTPLNYFATGYLKASGGIQVTASHNPAVYNGFKMSIRGASIYGERIQQLRKWIETGDFESGEASQVADREPGIGSSGNGCP